MSDKQKQLLQLQQDTLRIEQALVSIRASAATLQQLQAQGHVSQALFDQITKGKIEPLLEALKVNQEKMAALLLSVSEQDEDTHLQ